MKRRTFLRRLMVSGVAPLLAACARTFRIPLDVMARPEGGPGADRDPQGIWREGVAFARWTPSPHNIQPWRVRVLSPTRAELLYEPARLLPKTDPTTAFTTIGLAMFVEYLSVAVAPRGYTLRAVYVDRPLDLTATKPTLFATLELIPSAGPATFDRRLILERKTSRLPYDGQPVDDVTLKALEKIAIEHGQHFASSSDKAMVEWTLDLNRFTLFDDLDDTEGRNELRQWIRPSDEEAAQKKDGLWAHCLRYPGWLLKAFFDQHEKWGHGWRKNVCGNMLINGMHGTRTVAWWSGSFSRPEHWVSCGTMFARSWLELTRQGVGLHPFGSVITNRTAHQRLAERTAQLSAPVEGDQPLWLLVRLGRSAEAPRSYRRDEHDIFLDHTSE